MENTNTNVNDSQNIENTTISLEEYNKLKKSFDNASSELAKMKKESKAKMTEDEKKAQEQEELQKLRDEELATYKQELQNIKISKELTACGFDDKSINEIINVLNKGDVVAFAKDLATRINKLVENARVDEQEKLKRATPLPNNGGGNGNDITNEAKDYLARRGAKQTNKAQELYFGK